MELVSMGELLVDFTPMGMSEQGNPIFERNPGGGAANMACAAARLGVETAFLGKVGDDDFGRALKKVVTDRGVNTEGLLLSPEYQTSLAFVHLAEDGDRSFSFYRRQGADTMLKREELREELIKEAKYFYFSSQLLTGGDSRDTSYAAVKLAKESGAQIVFDVNLRLNLWEREEEAREQITAAMKQADVLKLSEEEAAYFTGLQDTWQAAEKLLTETEAQAVVITLGAQGSMVKTKRAAVIAGAPKVKAIDATGAGDSFTGAVVMQLLRSGKNAASQSETDWNRILSFANRAGALTCTRRGGISSLPTEDEILEME